MAQITSSSPAAQAPTGGRFKPGRSGNPEGARRADGESRPAAPRAPRARRMDDWVNFFTGQGVPGRDKRVGAHVQQISLTFDQLRDVWLYDDLGAVAVETIPREANREGYDLNIADAEDGGDESTLAADALDKAGLLGIDDALEVCGAYERGYGGGALLIGANDKQADWTAPLDLSKLASFDYVNALEARDILPVYAYADPRAPKYGQPEIYRMSTRSVLPSRVGFSASTMDVHESRLIIFPGIRVSRYQPLHARGGWGEAVLTRVYRVLRDFNAAYANAGVLVNDFAQAVIKVAGLWDALAQDGEGAFEKRLQAMELGRSAVNALTIDAADSYERQQTPMAGLPDLLERFAVRLAAACGMPLTLLFGTSPAGMNATGESDIRFFYDRVASYQTRTLLPKLRRLYQIIFASLKVREPAKWTIEFRPLWQESAKDKAAAMLTQAQADAAWIQAQVISPEEVGKSHWGKGPYDPNLRIDFTERDAQADLGSESGDEEAATLPGTGTAAGTEVAAQAFNGAQISSMLEIVKAATARTIPMESATAIIQTAFNLPADRARAITSSVASAPLPPTAPPPPIAPEDDEEDDVDEAVEPRADAKGRRRRRKVSPAPDETADASKEYVPPPPPGSAGVQPDVVPPGPPAAPDPNTPPTRMVQSEDSAMRARRDRYRLGRRDADWDESQHPRAEDGKFGSGGGDPGRTPDDRAADAVKTLVSEHRERLISAADRVRANYPREAHATDAVHEEAQKELRAEAGRIVREQAVVGNDPRLKAALEDSRYRTKSTGEQADKEHDALIAHVAERSAELAQHDAARAGGAVAPVPDEQLKAYQAAEAKQAPALDAAHAELDAAQRNALTAIGRYGAHAGEEDETLGVSHEEIAAEYAAAADRLAGKSTDDDDHPSSEAYEKLTDAAAHPLPEEDDIPDHFRDEDGDLKAKWEPEEGWEPEGITHDEAAKLNFSDDDEPKIEAWNPERFESEHGHLDPDALLGDADKRGHVSAEFDPSDFEPGTITAERYASMVHAWNAAADADRAAYDAIVARWNNEVKAHEAEDKAHFEQVKTAIAARGEATRKAADDAQAALEVLHGKQTAALAAAKATEKALAKPLAAAQEEVDDLDPDEEGHDHAVEHIHGTPDTDPDSFRMFHDDPSEHLYRGAQAAFAEDVAAARSTRSALGRRHGEETQSALADAAARTVGLVKALAKVSGRAPAIAKPRKKRGDARR